MELLELIASVKAQAAKVELSQLDKLVENLKKKKLEITADKSGNELKRITQLKDELGNLYTVVEKLNRKTKERTTTTTISEDFEKEAKAAQKAAAETKKAGEAHEQAAKQTEELGKQSETTAKNVDLLSTAFSRLGQIAISTATRAFRDALKEMKNVDSELVVVKKVTDASTEELEALRDRAYDTGKAYGVAASDYLSSVAEFSRAGYRDQAADLAELAVKLQLVGDVSQDVANQFLIATDKSFKFQGSADKLSETIDKANEIDNNYATTIEKVASGMGIIAPVAAQLNVSLDETMAAVGTITAVTQRSGTEAARALRAIMLNIVGDTKTEIEDGATWTAGEIKGLRDLLRDYAPQIVEEAEKMGTVINPMKAIGALAQAYKDGVLTAQELTERVSDIGGKLRTPQLLALIQNWDEIYLSIMEDLETAAGSADKEVGNALTGWQKKLDTLKTTWTDFVQETINSDFIKTGIDGLTWLIDSFGNLGNAIAVAIPFIIAFKGQDIASWFSSAAEAAGGFIGNILGLGETILDTGNAAEISAARFKGAMSLIGIAIAAVIMIVNNYKKSLDEAIAQGDKAAKEITTIQGLYDKYKELNESAKGTKEAEDARQALIDKLQDEGVWVDSVIGKYETLTEQIEAATKAAIAQRKVQLHDALSAAQTNIWWKDLWYQGFSDEESGNLAQKAAVFSGYEPELRPWKKYDVQELVNIYELANNKRAEWIADEQKYSEEEDKILKQFIDAYKPVLEDYITAKKNLDDLENSLEDVGDATDKSTTAIDQQSLSFVGLKDEINAATAALQKYKDSLAGGEKGDTLKQYAEVYKQAQELYKKGLFGSTQYQSALELLLPDNIKQQLAYDYKAMGDYVFGEFANGAYEALYGSGGEDFGATLATYLRDNAEGMEAIYEVANDNGKTFDLLIHDEEALAEQLGMTTEEVYAFMNALDIHHSDVMLSTKDVQDLIKSYGDLSKGVITDGVGLVKQLVDDGRTEGEIRNIIDQLDRAGQIDMGSLPEDLSDAIQEFQEIKEAQKDLPKEAVVEIKTDPESGYFSKVFADIKTLNGQKVVIGVSYKVEGTTASPYYPTAEAKSKYPTVKIDVPVKEYGSNWKGVDYATAGTSVLNEEGAELIVRGRKALIANDGKPTLFDLKAGDKVFNAKETKDILSSKRLLGQISDFESNQTDSEMPLIKTGKNSVSTVAGGVKVTYPDKKGGGGSKESDVKDSDLLAMLDDYISEMLDKAKKALDAQIDAIDAQIEKLKAEHDAEEEANELEELRLKILEAEKKLVDANVERTVRYFNKATGQWEWMADQKAVAEAQKSLEDAQKAYYDKLADIEYQAKLDELQAQKDALNENYDNLSDTWSEIKDEISKALSEKDVLELAEILTRLGLTAASGSVGGVNTLISDIDTFTGSFDNGGFALGKGLLRKATSKTETVLDDSITDRILSPRANAQFTSFTNSLSRLFGMSTGDIGAKAKSLFSTIDRSSSVVGDTYYINGVQIGSDMLDRPLSEVLSVLPIYAG